MILSASRRTDIPALYGEWLVNRLAAGEVLIPQPYRAHHATRLLFSPETVDVLERLERLEQDEGIRGDND